MSQAFPDPALGEPFLLTPGPLTTALEVKDAMLRDWGSWDDDFRAMTRAMRRLIATPGLAARLGAAARAEIAARYAPEKIAAEMAELLTDVLAR